LIVKNAIGGRFKIHSLDLSFNPGDIVDLSFHLSREEMTTNRELKKALEKGHLQPIDPRSQQVSAHTQFIPHQGRTGRGPQRVPSLHGHPSVRRAVFVEEHAEGPTSFVDYVLLSQLNRAAVVARTQNEELLHEIVREEDDPQLVASAQHRLGMLQGSS
jgi:hypothetical protein